MRGGKSNLTAVTTSISLGFSLERFPTVEIILNGPTNLGANFGLPDDLNLRFFVLNRTSCPTAYSTSLLDLSACVFILA